MMEQFEKVCKALGQGFGNGVGNAISFQYPGMEKKYNVTTLLGDALALIRQQQERIKELEAAQTARLMTLEEVHEMAWDYCYLEEEVIKDNVLQKYCGKHRVKCITWPSIASCVLTFGDDGYGKKWRCWTQRPTDEQRKAAKWDE